MSTSYKKNLKKINRWICWKAIDRGEDKISKVPISPKDGKTFISVNDPTQFSTFKEAEKTADKYDLGVGISLGDGLSCIDLDHCVGPKGISERAQQIVTQFGSYTEFSPSGLGIHIFYYGEKPGDRCRMKMGDFEIEIYERDRFITYTENSVLEDDTLKDCSSQIKDLYCEIFGEDIEVSKKEYGKIKEGKKKLKYALSHDKLLFDMWNGERECEDESRNDLAIVGKLCYWLERDPVFIHKALLLSPYFKSKSDKHQKKFKTRYKDYFLNTFEKANNALAESAWEWQNVKFTIKETEDKPVEIAKGITVKTSEFEEANKDLLVDDESDDDVLPTWLGYSDNGKSFISEVEFIDWFIDKWGLMCINGIMYNERGEIPDGYILHKIQKIIKPYVSKNLARQAKTLFDAIRNDAYTSLPRPRTNMIHINNQTLEVDAEKINCHDPQFTINRLNVNFDESAKCPQWLKFLDELIGPEYIPILQEYMGYCLTPTNIAQTACFIVGNGGEGKSIVVQVLQKILSRNQLTGQIHKLSSNNFMLSNLENRLAFLDDDINLAALDDTSTFKQLVTNNGEMLVERKGKQAHNAQIYAKILACGNGSLKSKYDKSDGFYRRLMLVKCLPKPKHRVDDKMLHIKILKETDGIFLWMLEGLQRLMGNAWYFSKSRAVEANIKELKDEIENIRMFMSDKEYVGISQIQELTSTSAELLDCYRTWCADNGYHPMSNRQVQLYLAKHEDLYGIKKSNKIRRGDVNKRGYLNIQMKQGSLNQSGVVIYHKGQKVR